MFARHISTRALLDLLSFLDAGRRLCLLLCVSVQHPLVSLQENLKTSAEVSHLDQQFTTFLSTGDC